MGSVTKKRIPILYIALMTIITAGLMITGISAYMFARDAALNHATIGNNEVTVNETFENPDIRANRVTTITKKVQVENTGINWSAIRVRIDFSSEDICDPGKMNASITYNTADWDRVEEHDGVYWYYRYPVPPTGENETTALFESVVIDNPDPESIKDFSVYVYAESRDCDPDSTLAEMKALYHNGPGA